uniref:Uperin-4.1 n=1 Tax=Uperoleia inundata TaxID=104953 RepID=UPE41_UPEIN|nr:RecName: Full=Uperin-4.1 [Uperoleia inundata]
GVGSFIHKVVSAIKNVA